MRDVLTMIAAAPFVLSMMAAILGRALGLRGPGSEAAHTGADVFGYGAVLPRLLACIAAIPCGLGAASVPRWRAGARWPDAMISAQRTMMSGVLPESPDAA